MIARVLSVALPPLLLLLLLPSTSTPSALGGVARARRWWAERPASPASSEPVITRRQFRYLPDLVFLDPPDVVRGATACDAAQVEAVRLAAAYADKYLRHVGKYIGAEEPLFRKWFLPAAAARTATATATTSVPSVPSARDAVGESRSFL